MSQNDDDDEQDNNLLVVPGIINAPRTPGDMSQVSHTVILFLNIISKTKFFIFIA